MHFGNFQVQNMAGTPEFMAPEVVNFEDIALETGHSHNKLAQYSNIILQINGQLEFFPSSFSLATLLS